MNYQTAMMEKVNLRKGDVIRDSRYDFSCTVKDINQDSVDFSDIHYTHPAEITFFAIKAFEILSKKLNVNSVNFLTRRGCIKIDKDTREKQLYHDLIRRNSDNW